MTHLGIRRFEAIHFQTIILHVMRPLGMLARATFLNPRTGISFQHPQVQLRQKHRLFGLLEERSKTQLVSVSANSQTGHHCNAPQRFAALISTAEPELCNYHLIHAEDDTLCDWHPGRADLHMLQQCLNYTYVTESARWMGSNKHQYWHWLHCQLPSGKVSLTDLKLSHPSVTPMRDRMAAPMRLASWIRFETVIFFARVEALCVQVMHKSP